MSEIAILGAGYMGSAISFPLRTNGHGVRLWGTWLDDELVRGCRDGLHPRLKKPLPEGVRIFDSSRLAEALAGVKAVFFGIASEGFEPVFRKLLEHLDPDIPVFSLTKGFVPLGDRLLRTSEAAEALARGYWGDRKPRWVSIGGPVKAVELSDGIPTASVYATSDPGLRDQILSFRTPAYRTIPGHDLAGLELCASLKNAYAILLGICDGLYRSGSGRLFDNVKAFFLTACVAELAVIVRAAGGSDRSAYGLPGMGDLHVTAQSGRNRRFGELIGGGIPASEAYRSMYEAGEIAEGFHAVRHGWEYARRLDPGLCERLPILGTLRGILDGGLAVREAAAALVERYPYR